MATPALVVVLLVALAVVVALVGLVLLLVRRLTVVARDLTELQHRLAPLLHDLQRDAEVTGRELGQVSASLEDLRGDTATGSGRLPSDTRASD